MLSMCVILRSERATAIAPIELSPEAATSGKSASRFIVFPEIVSTMRNSESV